jgi:hypothetical protein
MFEMFDGYIFLFYKYFNKGKLSLTAFFSKLVFVISKINRIKNYRKFLSFSKINEDKNFTFFHSKFLQLLKQKKKRKFSEIKIFIQKLLVKIFLKMNVKIFRNSDFFSFFLFFFLKFLRNQFKSMKFSALVFLLKIFQALIIAKNFINKKNKGKIIGFKRLSNLLKRKIYKDKAEEIRTENTVSFFFFLKERNFPSIDKRLIFFKPSFQNFSRKEKILGIKIHQNIIISMKKNYPEVKFIKKKTNYKKNCFFKYILGITNCFENKITFSNIVMQRKLRNKLHIKFLYKFIKIQKNLSKRSSINSFFNIYLLNRYKNLKVYRKIILKADSFFLKIFKGGGNSNTLTTFFFLDIYMKNKNYIELMIFMKHSLEIFKKEKNLPISYRNIFFPFLKTILFKFFNFIYLAFFFSSKLKCFHQKIKRLMEISSKLLSRKNGKNYLFYPYNLDLRKNQYKSNLDKLYFSRNKTNLLLKNKKSSLQMTLILKNNSAVFDWFFSDKWYSDLFKNKDCLFSSFNFINNCKLLKNLKKIEKCILIVFRQFQISKKYKKERKNFFSKKLKKRISKNYQQTSLIFFLSINKFQNKIQQIFFFLVSWFLCFISIKSLNQFLYKRKKIIESILCLHSKAIIYTNFLKGKIFCDTEVIFQKIMDKRSKKLVIKINQNFLRKNRNFSIFFEKRFSEFFKLITQKYKKKNRINLDSWLKYYWEEIMKINEAKKTNSTKNLPRGEKLFTRNPEIGVYDFFEKKFIKSRKNTGKIHFDFFKLSFESFILEIPTKTSFPRKYILVSLKNFLIQQKFVTE